MNEYLDYQIRQPNGISTMNGTVSSPISDRIERYVVTTNLITGSLFFFINISVLIWISRVDSVPNKSHLHHFATIQCLLILIDLFFSFSNPLLIRDSFSLFSPRFFLPSFLDATACMTVALFFILSVGNVFFSSVLTRYQSVIPLHSPNRFPKWRLTLMRYIHSLNFLFIPLFYYSLHASKLSDEETAIRFPWITHYPIHIVLNFTPLLKAILLVLIILSLIPMAFTFKLFFRMVHTITLRTSVTTVKTLSHDSLIYALALETLLPLAAFGIPALGLTLGLILSHYDPAWNALSFLLHSSHALFVSLITIIFYLRYRQTPNQYISTKIAHLSDDMALPSLLPHHDA